MAVLLFYKGPVRLMQRVKIAHSFLQSVSNQFHVIILSFSSVVLQMPVKEPISKNGE